MRLPFVITTIKETARFCCGRSEKSPIQNTGEYESRALALRPGRFYFPSFFFHRLLRPSMCSSRSGLLSARRGSRIKSIPSRLAKRRRTHRHRRQSKDRHRRAKRRRPAAQQAKKSRRKARNGHADSKSFHAVPTGRPPSGRTGGAATRMRPSPHPGSPPKRHRKTRAASRGTAANYIAQAAPAGRWPALCESGKENCKHRKFPCLQNPCPRRANPPR